MTLGPTSVATFPHAFVHPISPEVTTSVSSAVPPAAQGTSVIPTGQVISPLHPGIHVCFFLLPLPPYSFSSHPLAFFHACPFAKRPISPEGAVKLRFAGRCTLHSHPGLQVFVPHTHYSSPSHHTNSPRALLFGTPRPNRRDRRLHKVSIHKEMLL